VAFAPNALSQVKFRVQSHIDLDSLLPKIKSIAIR
jgi:hypothetical protein